MPLATSGASILSSTVRAAGAVIVPREREGMPEGEEVEVRLYDRNLDCVLQKVADAHGVWPRQLEPENGMSVCCAKSNAG